MRILGEDCRTEYQDIFTEGQNPWKKYNNSIRPVIQNAFSEYLPVDLSTY